MSPAHHRNPDPPRSPARDYDHLPMPAVQAFGQDDVGPTPPRPAEKKAGAWSDVGLEAPSATAALARKAPTAVLSPPKASVRKIIRKARASPNSTAPARPRPQIAAKKVARTPAPAPDLTQRPLPAKRKTLPSPELRRDSSADPQSASMSPPRTRLKKVAARAARKSVPRTEPPARSASDPPRSASGSPPRARRMQLTTRAARKSTWVSKMRGDSATDPPDNSSSPPRASRKQVITRAGRKSTMVAALRRVPASDAPASAGKKDGLPDRAPPRKQVRGSMEPLREQPDAISRDGDIVEAILPNVACRTMVGNRYLRVDRTAGSLAQPNADTLAGAFGDSASNSQEAIPERCSKTKTGPRKRKRAIADVTTSRRRGISSVVEPLESAESGLAVAHREISKPPGETVGGTKERKAIALIGKKGDHFEKTVRKNTLFRASPSRGSDSDKEVPGDRDALPACPPAKPVKEGKKLKKKNISDRKVKALPDRIFDGEVLVSPAKRFKGCQAVQKFSKSKVIPPNASRGGKEKITCNGFQRCTVDEVDPDVMKEIEGAMCLVCKELGGGEQMVLCDSCCAGCHLFCMTPKRKSVPLGVWVCPDCHQTALRHQIHMSRMIRLRWHLECLECLKRNDPDVERDCDKACSDCRVAFHSTCLRRYSNVSAAGLRDPNWKCSVCAALSEADKCSNNHIATAKESREVVPPHSRTERNKLESLDGGRASHDPSRSKEAVVGEPDGYAGKSIVEIRGRPGLEKPQRVLKRLERGSVVGKHKAIRGSRVAHSTPDMGLRKVERLALTDSERTVSGAVATEGIEEKSGCGAAFEDHMEEEDVILDGSGLSESPMGRQFGSAYGANDGTRLDTFRVIPLFRSSGGRKNAGDSGQFKHRSSYLSSDEVTAKRGNNETAPLPSMSREAKKHGNVKASGTGKGSRKPRNNGKNTKSVFRDASLFRKTPGWANAPELKSPCEPKGGVLHGYNGMDWSDAKDEEILDGGFAI